MAEWWLLAAIALLAWFWQDSIAKRDLAVQMGQQLADRCRLQFLDETVSCSHLRLARNARGQMQLQRTYTFEVAHQGHERMSCHLQLLGSQLINWHIPPYQISPQTVQ